MNPTVLGYLAVFLGGGLGAAIRHCVNRAMHASPAIFPASTMLINIAGCLLMGAVAGWFSARGQQSDPQNLWLFLTTGILGGFTTFSAYSLDAALLWQRNDLPGFFVYVLGTVLLCLVAVFTGLALSRAQFAS